MANNPLHALMGLMLLSMLSSRKGMMATFRLGRGLTARQLRRLGFRPGHASPCHATLTETLRVLEPTAMAQAFGQLTAETGAPADTDINYLSLDGKTLRGSKDADGKAEHVLSAFCVTLDQSVGPVSSRGKGMEIPDALRLIDQLDLTGKIVTGDALFCQKTITSKVVGKGGDDVLPVKGNRKDLRDEIETAFTEPVFPLAEWHEPPQSGHGRIDQRHIALLPVEALGEEMRKSWPTIRFIARLERGRDHVRRGRVIRTERETIYRITSRPTATPKRIMSVNRSHWRIKAMHRDKDVTPGEDRHTNRLDHAPQNIFTLTSATRTVLKRISNSPTRAIETFQTSRITASRFLA